MSTSEESGAPPPEYRADASLLERLANELFRARPDANPSDAAQPASVATRPVPAAPRLDAIGNDLAADIPLTAAAPIAVDLPGEAELNALLGRLGSVYGGADAARAIAPNRPDYYFLELARQAPAAAHVPEAASHSASSALPFARAPFDVNRVRGDFPILAERVNGRPLVWLDSAATTQKPRAVIDRLNDFYRRENSNVHRAAHELAARATDAYEAAREKVRAFLNASSPREIVFLRGATEAINLVAQSWGRRNIGKDDEIVITWLEHHANIVPWVELANEKGAKVRVAPVDDTGQVLLSEYGKLLGPKTKLVAFAHVSNALGTITPAKRMVEMAHATGARVLVDGAQAVSHLAVDVQTLDADWYLFSGHKLYAPMGVGALYGKEALLNEMPPWQGGGNMIEDVTFDRIQYQRAPARFEAGTGTIGDAVGLGAAIDYVTAIGLDVIGEYEHQLLHYATTRLADVPGLRLFGTAAEKAGVLSFVLNGHTPEDVGQALNREGVAVRAGHHCAQPILRRFGVEKTVRASFGLYNTCADVDALIDVLHKLSSRRAPAAASAAAYGVPDLR